MMEDRQAHLIKQIVKDSEVIFKILQRQPSPKLYVIRNTMNKMKIIKLDKRFNMYKEGYTHAMRWRNYEPREVNPYEAAMRIMYGDEWYAKGNSWHMGFGNVVKGSRVKPYFIYVKSESMLTMLLLKINHESN
jgi:hypothetical protein